MMMILQPIAAKEEGGVDIPLRQPIQKPAGKPAGRAVIKGQRNVFRCFLCPNRQWQQAGTQQNQQQSTLSFHQTTHFSNNSNHCSLTTFAVYFLTLFLPAIPILFLSSFLFIKSSIFLIIAEKLRLLIK